MAVRAKFQHFCDSLYACSKPQRLLLFLGLEFVMNTVRLKGNLKTGIHHKVVAESLVIKLMIGCHFLPKRKTLTLYTFWQPLVPLVNVVLSHVQVVCSCVMPQICLNIALAITPVFGYKKSCNCYI